MAQASTIMSANIRVLLDIERNDGFAVVCGFNANTITFSKGLEEVQIPDCDDPDKVSWMGRDAVSMSIGVDGEGVIATESVEAMLDEVTNTESVPAKIEIEWPAKTITYTGRLHVETFAMGRQNGRRVTMNSSMQSDGEFVKTTTTGS